MSNVIQFALLGADQGSQRAARVGGIGGTMKRQSVREVFDAAYYAALEDGLTPDEAAQHAAMLQQQEAEQRMELLERHAEGDR